MVKRCFVYKCPTGRKVKDGEYRYSLFKAPNDIDLLEEWRRYVPTRERELNSNDRICEKHFEKRYVMPRFQQSRYGDFYEDCVRPKLTPDAVPTLFDGADVKSLKYSNENCVSTKAPSLILPPVEVNENDVVFVCYNCLLEKCPAHKDKAVMN